VISVKVKGVPEIQRKLDHLYTDEGRREDLTTFKKRGERKYRKGLGGRNNTVTGKVETDLRMVLTTTTNRPRGPQANSWKREFIYSIYPSMAKRVFRSRAKKIEERWRA